MEVSTRSARLQMAAKEEAAPVVIGNKGPVAPTTGIVRSRGRHASGKPPRTRWLASHASWLLVGAIVTAAWAIRAIGITTNYDVFIDEVTYTRIAESLATGRGLTLYGVPFDLHPPAEFALFALIIKTFSLHGQILDLLYALRPFVALIGALSCGLVFVLVSSLTSWKAGLIAACIVAADPFEIYYDSHVMLEAPAQLASVGTILLLCSAIACKSNYRSWTLTVLAGFTAGVAISSKEYFGLVLFFAFIFCIMTGWSIRRIQAAVALGIMLACYLLSEAMLVLSGGLKAWKDQVGSGLRRLVGTEQITGFNSTTVHVSLLSRVAANAAHYGATYVILVCGALVGIIALIHTFRQYRAGEFTPTAVERGRILVNIWAVASACYLAYATLFGTLEEQMYYLLYMPAACLLAIGVSRLLTHSMWHVRSIVLGVIAAFLLIDCAVWIAVHRTPDTAYRQLAAWVPKNVPAGSTVAATEYTAQFILQDVQLGEWATIPEIKKHHADYVLLSTNLVSQGYGIGKPSFEQYLEEHAKVVFRVNGPSIGSLELFDVRAITGAK